MATSITKKKATLDTILSEVRSLRREVSLFLPTESTDDFKNKKEIVAAYQNAKK